MSRENHINDSIYFKSEVTLLTAGIPLLQQTSILFCEHARWIYKVDRVSVCVSIRIVPTEFANSINKTVDIDNCYFEGNHAANGAAITHLGGDLTLSVTNCSFVNNRADDQGSCLWITNLSGTPSIQVTFTNNLIYGNNQGVNAVSGMSGVPLINAENCWWGAADGPSGVGSGHGQAVNAYVDYTPYLTGNEPAHQGAVGDLCGMVYSAQAHTNSSNPIELQYGEKRELMTDLVVNTPAGPLTFTRSYRQGKQSDSRFQFMGLGWTHNHLSTLTLTGSSPTRTAEVLLPGGGTLVLTEQSSGHFVATVGSNATMDYVSGNNTYALNGTDGTHFIFDGTSLQLSSIQWASNEVWTYSYTSGKLSSVDDGYSRQLRFSYINNAGQYDHGQLWRVGDHTASGLDTGSPSGRYIEMAYTPEKNNGSTIANPKALLLSVQDVLGNVWTYDYYGQHSGESTSGLLNFITQRQTPSVDTSGDGSADGVLTLEQLTYTLSGSNISTIQQQSGLQGGDPALMTRDFAFQPSGQNLTTETVAGKVTTYDFGSGIFTNVKDPAGNTAFSLPNQQFRVASKRDGNNNATLLGWSSEGRFLLDVTDALNNRISFVYNDGGASDGTLQSSLDAQGRQATYEYGDGTNPRLPTRIKVFDQDTTTVLIWQEFTYDSQGRMTFEKLRSTDGATVLQQTERTYYTNGNGNGLLQTVKQKDLLNSANDVTTTYFYDNVGRVQQVNQSATFGNCTKSYTVYDAAGNVVASLCNYTWTGTAPQDADDAADIASQSLPEENRVTTYKYDTAGRRIETTTEAGRAYALTTLTVYDALGRVIRSIANYKASASVTHPYTAPRSAFRHGEDNTQNLITETAYNERGLVRSQTDVLGSVTLFGYDDAGRLVKTIVSASQPGYNNTYGTGGDPALSQYVANDAPDLDLIATSQYDAAGNLIQSVDALGHVSFTVYDALNRPVKTVQNAKDGATVDLKAGDPLYQPTNDPRSALYEPSSAADRDLITTTEYDSLGHVSRTTDVLGSVTLFGYDGLGRQVKTIRAASQPDYNVVLDPSLSAYVANEAADQDIVTQTAYDTQGRVMYTQDVLGRQTWSVYDGLGRQVKTLVNPIHSASDGSYRDPRSSFYQPTINVADRDLILQTVYDSNGYVLYTVNPQGQKTWFGYDDLGRQTRTILNALGTATNSSPSDPRSAGYIVSEESDRDVITETRYDAQGRVFETINARGYATRSFYDVLGRRIKTIANFTTGTPSADPNYSDLDQTSTVSYDLAGRVSEAVDVRGTHTTHSYDRAGRQVKVTVAAGTPRAMTTYTCYDKAGRVLRSIANYLPAANDASPDARDLNGSFIFNPSTHGTHNDQNLIAVFSYDRAGRQTAVADPAGNSQSTAYDKDGQMESTTDPLGIVTRFRYDRLRRRWRVVQAHTDNGEDPALWQWRVANTRWEKSNGTAISFGTDNDQNIIAEVEYDKAGRVLAQRDPRGNRTSYTYDMLDRRVGLTNALGYTWVTTYEVRGDGRTRITRINPLGHAMQYDYDLLGRTRFVTAPNESPKVTLDLEFYYPRDGSYLDLRENDENGLVRFATPWFDAAGRIYEVAYDTNGNEVADQFVDFWYDAGGLRLGMLLPDGKEIDYEYDEQGRMTQLDSWVGAQSTSFSYDGVGRLLSASRPNSITTQYTFDVASRLTRLKHYSGANTLADFQYTLNALGHRTGVVETLAQNPSGSTTHNATHTYDKLSRLKQTIYRQGSTLGSGTIFRQYDHTFDVAGNRTQQVVTVSGTPTTTNWTYNALNQITNAGFSYDNAGRMTHDGVNAYTWDRNDRLLSMGSTSYLYNGWGHRIQRTVSGTVTNYVVDPATPLPVVLTAATGVTTVRYLHTPLGMQQQQTGSTWRHMLADGLGSERVITDTSRVVQESRSFGPYGDLWGQTGSSQGVFGFTGEMKDGNDLYYLRARYYNPAIGQFFNLDPVEGQNCQPLSLNRYAYVQGNVANRVDPSGLWGEMPQYYAPCTNTDAASPRLFRRGGGRMRGGSVWGINYGPGGGCDDPDLDYDTKRSLGCFSPVPIPPECFTKCDKEYPWWLTEGIAGVDWYDKCIQTCVSEKAKNAPGCQIAVYSNNVNYLTLLHPEAPEFERVQPNHAFIVFWADSSRTDGTGTVFRAVPLGSALDGTGKILAGSFPDNTINGDYDYWKRNSGGTGPVILLGGLEACRRKACLEHQVQRTNALQLPYYFLNQNSNTFVRGVLESCGIPVIPPGMHGKVGQSLPGWENPILVEK